MMPFTFNTIHTGARTAHFRVFGSEPHSLGARRPYSKAAWFQLGTFIYLCFCFCLPVSASGPEPLSDRQLAQIRFDQNLNTQVTLNLPFVDESGREVRLGQYFGGKPVVLVLGYYQCPMLCTLVLNGLLECAADMKWCIGRDYEVIDVSIDPHETHALAAAKQRAYVKRYGRPSAAQGWHFLTGAENPIRQLANEVGFHYAYDPVARQYAHPSGLIILTPEGKVSGYLFGVTYSSKELYESLLRASTRQVSSPLKQFILLCFHYNPMTGKYSGLIMTSLRLLSAGGLLGFLWFIIRLARRGPAPSPAASATAPPPPAPATEPSPADSRFTVHDSRQ